MWYTHILSISLKSNAAVPNIIRIPLVTRIWLAKKSIWIYKKEVPSHQNDLLYQYFQHICEFFLEGGVGVGVVIFCFYIGWCFLYNFVCCNEVRKSSFDTRIKLTKSKLFRVNHSFWREQQYANSLI